MLSRRTFLAMAGGAAATSAGVGAAVWAALVRDHVDAALAGASGSVASELPAASGTTGSSGASGASTAGHVLVVLQLGGGNDGLNTLVPAVGRYRDARPKIAIPEAQLVSIDTPGYGLHPALFPLRGRWNAGQIAAFEGIGLRAQTRSHFKAMDTWWAGTDGATSATGWLGRWLDATEGATPNPLRSISLGTGAPALIGERSLPTVVLSPAQFALRLPRTTDAKAVTAAFLATAAPASAAPWQSAAQSAIPSALDAIAVLDRVRLQAAATADDPSASGPTGATGSGAVVRAAADSATSLLQTAAGIIELGIGTRVILVGISGFDTHSDELDRHQDLLADVAQAITAFFDRLQARGKADNVLLVTTSEFGRRVSENASGGTDHGNGGVQFIVGSAVKGRQVVGEPALDRLVDGDVPIGIDTRSLYALGLDWLGGPTDELLGARFDRYGLL